MRSAILPSSVCMPVANHKGKAASLRDDGAHVAHVAAVAEGQVIA
jgi:hypothetical protein